jgi:predicted metal-dependent phosphotriesterase family hydrolase
MVNVCLEPTYFGALRFDRGALHCSPIAGPTDRTRVSRHAGVGARRLLLSQDVFLKMMLTRYGGYGYGYILKHFVPRLRRHGVTDPQMETMLVANPARVFSRRQAK